ncbi:hypothetical protein CLV80_10952 [Yoonia maritima]|uniref:Uncharacterized protein n=1 Tax=Yoonia maritima TaxID=1435347 RepID=A0A2T0VWJ0_9RHOB|nr:hypothetical protein CLV80_10952 [Yoonia maritima]
MVFLEKPSPALSPLHPIQGIEDEPGTDKQPV